MNAVAVDFKNKVICIMKDGQKTCKDIPELEKTMFKELLPEGHLTERFTSFTWDFERETLACNQEYRKLKDESYKPECLRPEIIEQMRGLKKRFMELLKSVDCDI